MCAGAALLSRCFEVETFWSIERIRFSYDCFFAAFLSFLQILVPCCVAVARLFV